MLPKPLCEKLEREERFDEAFDELLDNKPLVDALLASTTSRSRRFEPLDYKQSPPVSEAVYQSLISLLLMKLDDPPKALVEHAPGVRVHRATRHFEAERLGRFLNLYALELSHVPLPSLEGLTRLERLEQLSVRRCGLKRIRAALPSLQWLSLSEEEPVDLSGLTSAPKLHSMTLFDVNALGELPQQITQLLVTSSPKLRALDGLSRCQALSSLRIEVCEGLEHLKGLEGGSSLRTVWLSWCGALRSLEGLQTHTALERLDLLRCPNLADLSHVPPSSALSSLSLHEISGLRSLKGLPGLPQLKALDLRSCPALERLEGIEALEALEALSLKSAALEDVAPLSKLPNLKRLDLRGCDKLACVDPLADAPELRVVALMGTAVDKKRLPKPLSALATFARAPKLEELALRARPDDKKTKMTQKERSQLASVRRMLKSKEIAQVDQALELLRTVARIDWCEELLKSAVVTQRPGWTAPILSNAYNGALQHYVLLGLIDASPKGSKKIDALAAQLTELTLFGARGYIHGRDMPLSPSCFARFENLARITLERVGPLIKRGPAPRLPALERLSLRYCDPLELWWLQDAPRLVDLTLCGANLDLQPLAAVRSLEHLTLTATSPPLHEEALIGHPRLRSIHLLSPALSQEVLMQLPALKELSLSSRATELDTSALEAKGIKVGRG